MICLTLAYVYYRIAIGFVNIIGTGATNMSFKTNKNQQMGMNDPIYTMSDRELKILRGSWAEDFANCIFPNINEEPFSVLFSGRSDSKPNAPINVILGLLILKEQFGLTDEECMHQLIFNKQFQYALHTSSFKEQPVNDNIFSKVPQQDERYPQRACRPRTSRTPHLGKKPGKAMSGLSRISPKPATATRI